jgi:predicted phosphodiesterase
MPNWLLFSDTHFTDNPLEEYRWGVWDKLRDLCREYKVTELVHCGDLTDRKDRHSSVLLNRLSNELATFHNLGVYVHIVMGNHDMAISGPNYWQVLNHISNVAYVTVPKSYLNDQVLFLPFSSNPIEEWKELKIDQKKCIFLHQTVSGVEVERGHVIEQTSTPMPVIPVHVAAFSGDIHRPQKVGGVQYVGTPYPVRMGEDWPGQVILIKKDDFLHPEVIVLPSIRRTILNISSTIELPLDQTFKTGDQVRIRYNLPSDSVGLWGTIEQECKDWADRTGCSLLSCEAILVEVRKDDEQKQAQIAVLEALPPSEVVSMFGKENRLSDLTIDVGLELLKSAF